MTEKKLTLAEKLFALRKSKNYSRLDLAKLANVATGTLYFYEKGLRVPSVAILQKLSTALETTLAEFDDCKSSTDRRFKKA